MISFIFKLPLQKINKTAFIQMFRSQICATGFFSAFPDMPILETSRIRLRMFTMDDLEELIHIFEKPTVMKYLGREGKPMTGEETETALISIIKHWERNGFGRWAVESKKNGKLIGCSGLRSYEDTAELVYLIDEPYWGKGLATEIALACLDFGFNNRRFNKIIAFARPQNTASRRIMEKIGMRFVGETTVFGVFVVQYEIQNCDYQSRRSKELHINRNHN